MPYRTMLSQLQNHRLATLLMPETSHLWIIIFLRRLSQLLDRQLEGVHMHEDHAEELELILVGRLLVDETVKGEFLEAIV